MNSNLKIIALCALIVLAQALPRGEHGDSSEDYEDTTDIETTTKTTTTSTTTTRRPSLPLIIQRPIFNAFNSVSDSINSVVDSAIGQLGELANNGLIAAQNAAESVANGIGQFTSRLIKNISYQFRTNSSNTIPQILSRTPSKVDQRENIVSYYSAH